VSCKKETGAEMRYSIYVGTSDDEFNNDRSAVATGNGIVGEVVILINSNPISFFSGYGDMIQINHWLRMGENTLSFRGQSSEDIYFKIVSTDKDGGNFQVLSKGFIQSGKIESNNIFDPNVNYFLPIFDSSLSSFTKDDIKSQVQKEIALLNKLIREKQQEGLVGKLFEGPAIWHKKAYDVNWCNVSEFYKKNIKKQFIDSSIADIGLDLNDLHVRLGENIAFVYSGIDNDGRRQKAYLFKMGDVNNPVYIPPVKYFKLNEKWCIWQ